MSEENKANMYPKLVTLSWSILVAANCLVGVIGWPSFETYVVFFIFWWCELAVAAISLIVMLLMGFHGWRSVAVCIAVAVLCIGANAHLVCLTVP